MDASPLGLRQADSPQSEQPRHSPGWVMVDLTDDRPPWRSAPRPTENHHPDGDSPAAIRKAADDPPVAQTASHPEVARPAVALTRVEPLSIGVRRLCLEHLDYARTILEDDRIEPESRVHEVRKALRRIRGVLRMMLGELGTERYQLENRALRDMGRLLSEARSSAVAVNSLAALEKRYRKQLRPDAFSTARSGLEERRSAAQADALGHPVLSRLLDELNASRTRLEALGDQWPIRDSFPALAPGLARTYRRGRKRMEDAYRDPTPSALHEWRKRVRYLRFQMETLTGIWPEMMKPFAGTLDELGEALGVDHDLAELALFVRRHRELTPGKHRRELLGALIEGRRSRLQHKAWALGDRVYTEPTGRFVDRIGGYWHAWRG